MKMPRPRLNSRILLSVGFLACLMCAGIVHAQVPATPEQAAQSKLTPYQQARDKALVVCFQALNEQNVPTEQRKDFMTACVQAEGVVEPTPVPTAAPVAQ